VAPEGNKDCSAGSSWQLFAKFKIKSLFLIFLIPLIPLIPLIFLMFLISPFPDFGL
jgi:hypothetical protein